MSIRFPKRYYVILAILAILTAVALVWSTSRIIQNEKRTRTVTLESANQIAAAELQEALVSYATLISGMKTFVEMQEGVPSKDELQAFITSQINDLLIDPPFSISYIDTSHVIVYDITMTPDDEYELEGTSMDRIIGEAGIKRMDSLMKRRSFYASDPTNLLEGRVGLPLGFGVLDSLGNSVGYISTVAEVAPIVNRVYEHSNSSDVIYSFQSSNGNYFDRTKSYNDQPINTGQTDPDFFQNYEVDESEFIYSTVPFYNKTFTIGTAFKEPYAYSGEMFVTSALWYLLIIGFMFFIISQFYIYERKNKVIAAQKEQLTELVATKNKFFTIIAHDLRSPLSSIINFLDILKEERFENQQTNHIFSQLEDSSRNSITLLDNLLKWSKMQTGKMHYNPEPLDLMAITKDQIKVQKDALDKKGIQVRIESTFNGKVQGDKNMIATVIRNLLSNAIKFSHPNGILVIEINKLDQQVSFSIEDNGIGISATHLPKVLDVSTMTRQAGTRDEKGSGLGLILSQQFVNAHQGKLAIESEEGKGTIVSFSLPL